MRRFLSLMLPLTLLLAGCPPPRTGEVVVTIETGSLALLPGESRTLEVLVRCSYAPCDGLLTMTPRTALPAGVSIDGFDDPPQATEEGTAWRWTLVVRSGPTTPAFEGTIDFSARPADGHGFAASLVPVGDSVLLTIAPPPPATPLPVARFAFSPESPTIGQPITFDATASTGTIASYRWDFGADGSLEATGPTATYSFGVAGAWPVRLQLVALDGTAAEATQTVLVGGGGGGGDATLTLSFTGSGSGVVTFDPPVTACSRDGEPVCNRLFADGSTVVLTASAYSGHTLGGWGPGCSGIGAAGAQCTIVMDGNRQISLRID